MSNVIINDSNLTNIANAIRTKNKSSATYTPAEMSAAINNIKTSEDIDGVIESYKSASGTISANDFVEFVETYKTPYQLSTTSYSGYYCSACAIDDNKVFITHSSSSSASGYLYGMVCTIGDDGSITKGEDIQLSSTTYSNRYQTVVALEKNKVYISYGAGTTYPYTYGMVCTINGTTITKGTEKQIISNTYSGLNCSLKVVVLNPNKVVVFNAYTSSYVSYAIVCDIDGTTITPGTNTAIFGNSCAGYFTDALVMKDDTILAVANVGNSTSPYLYGIAFTVSGTTITLGTQVTLGSTSYESYELALHKLDDTTAYLVFCGTSRYSLQGRKLHINGTTITADEKQTLNDYYIADGTSAYSNCGYGLTSAYYNGKIYVFHSYMGSANTYQIGVAIISDLDKDKQSVRLHRIDSTASSYASYNIRPGSNFRACVLNNGNIFCAHAYNTSYYYLYGTVINLNKVKKAVDHIDGVALDNITTSTAGRVKTLRR